MAHDDLLSAALRHHRAGDLDAAEALYRRILLADPRRHAARHLLGVLAHQRGRSGEAASLIAEAIRANGTIAEYHGNLGLALAALGRHVEAEACQRRALALRADYPEAHHNLGLVLAALGRHGEAIGHFADALRLRPGFAPAVRALAGALHSDGRLADAAEAYAEALRLDPRNPVLLNDFGLALRDLGRDGDAARCFDAALALHPDFAEAWDNLGALKAAQGHMEEAAACHRAALARRWDSAAAWNNLGIALNALGRGDEAIAAWRQAVILEPGQTEAWSNLGNGLRDRDGFDDAIACHHRALRVVPAQPAANNNHGHALQGMGRHGEAARWFRRALALDPAYAEALSNLGLAVQRSGRTADAERLYNRALALQPGLALARFDRSLLRLERGDLAGGWADYGARFASGRIGAGQSPPLPPWRGEDLAGKRLLVWGEQGVGDTILFASLIPEVVGWATAVVVEVDPRMVPLFARSFPMATVRAPADDAGGCDVQAPVGSLAGWFRTTLADFPGRPAWLTPDPALVERWRDRLAALGPGLRVGIGWRSQVMTEERRAAYTALEAWEPVFALPGLHLVNLQYGDCATELAEAESRFGRAIHRWDDLDLKDDFDGMAALVANLDLVLSPAMSVGELAGALGVPVWRVGRRDWTQLGTGVRPWFPAQRLFQPAPEETLGDVPARVARALAAMARSRNFG
ncbi:tetratricopeptide repeat protein [Azospirillum rugosum]|uniref:Tetratricopeptide (TPR) repeat protein n=1 Tax=Azospirillum rugosum TaxID=416170 RepID=A0ABS4SJH9_9PROT|nr:tetratricopeptide repeat protein [Azospirillum rugosum]MBP2292723.1 tetratricopeptide (TPR) repeat protein [Azospirillum rugosum]MDQ0526253.1 tetratricopeptide (TPR) repeat protein [Azospirillum rugosum]